jgi:hypothetical protein
VTDGWYYATSPKATFGFEIDRGRVTAVAPYGRRWLLGRTDEEAVAALGDKGYVLQRGGPTGERCAKTFAMARCVKSAGHDGGCLWEDVAWFEASG